MNKREIDIFYPRLVQRDGEFCSFCQKTPFELGVDKLKIHEIKYERPLKLANMRLFCHACNCKSEFSKENIGERPETPEYKVSRQIKPLFLEWLAGEMQKGNWHITYTEAIAGGALYTGRSITTIKNWLYPLLYAKNSPYSLWGDDIYLRGHEPRKSLPDRPQEFSNETQQSSK